MLAKKRVIGLHRNKYGITIELLFADIPDRSKKDLSRTNLGISDRSKLCPSDRSKKDPLTTPLQSPKGHAPSQASAEGKVSEELYLKEGVKSASAPIPSAKEPKKSGVPAASNGAPGKFKESGKVSLEQELRETKRTLARLRGRFADPPTKVEERTAKPYRERIRQLEEKLGWLPSEPVIPAEPAPPPPPQRTAAEVLQRKANVEAEIARMRQAAR
jgi:hypothetical protein